MQKSIGTNRLEMAAKLWSAYMDHDSTGEMVRFVLLHVFVHFVTVFSLVPLRQMLFDSCLR